MWRGGGEGGDGGEKGGRGRRETRWQELVGGQALKLEGATTSSAKALAVDIVDRALLLSTKSTSRL